MSEKWYIHINKNVIQRNAKRSEREPVIRVQKGKHGPSAYGFNVLIPDGSRVLYDPDNAILPCGAKLVIECFSEPIVEG